VLTAQDESWLLVPFAVLWVAAGWLLGLLLNRVSFALSEEVSPVGDLPCPSCRAPIPLVRIWSRTCSACGASQPYDRLEWLVGGLFGALALRYGPTAPVIAYSVYTAALALTAVIDYRYRYVYSIVSLPSIILALLLTPLLTGVDVLSALLGTGIAIVIFVAFYLLGRLVYRASEPVGKGDIELAAVIGAMVGFPRIFNALFLGSFVNGIFIVILLLSRRRGRWDFIPYGPGLCIGAFATFFMAP
jgi:leader peptidase (prepilin peptidase)/N-methyltransferase